MTMTVRLMLAQSPDQKHWIATASDGTVVRAFDRREAEKAAREKLIKSHGADLAVEAEVIWHDRYLQAQADFRAAGQEAKEAQAAWKAALRSTVLDLLRDRVGGVLKQGLDEIAQALQITPWRIYGVLQLKPSELADLEPTTPEAPLKMTVGLAAKLERLHAARARCNQANDNYNQKMSAADLETYKAGEGPHPDEKCGCRFETDIR